MNTGFIVLRRLFDQNGISLSSNSKLTSNFKVVPNADEFAKHFEFMPADRERDIRRRLYNSEDHLFVVKYSIVGTENKRDCITQEISPAHIGFDFNQMNRDYNIRFHPVTKEIVGVSNRTFGDVQYRAIKVEASGFVMGSVMKLWTTLIAPQVLNIVHIHLNDTSDEATVDVCYVKDDDELTLIDNGDFRNQTFPKDAAGLPLRYKILVHAMKIKAVLYNTGNSIERVNFREMRLEQPSAAKPGQFVNVQHLTRRKFCRVQHVPVAMLASPSREKLETLTAGQVSFPMEVHCEARSFDKLLGYVDLHVLSTDGLCSIKVPPEQISAAIC